MAKRVLITSGILFTFVVMTMSVSTYAWIMDNRTGKVGFDAFETVEDDSSLVVEVKSNKIQSTRLRDVSGNGNKFYKAIPASIFTSDNQVFASCYDVTNSDGYFNDYTVTVKLSDDTDYISPYYIYLSSSSYVKGSNEDNLINAARVSFSYSINDVNYTKVWSPYSSCDEYVSGETITKGKLQVSHINSSDFINSETFKDVTSYTATNKDEVFTADNPYIGAITSKEDKITLNVKIWAEGQDPVCIDENRSEVDISVKLGFIGTKN